MKSLLTTRLRSMGRTAWLLLLVGLVGTAQAREAAPFFGIYGKIAGTVVDAATGEPLPGVNVVIEGTSQGSATDVDGAYTILQVRPGTYTVRATFIGFATQVIENVVVQVDKTTTVNFELREQVFEGEEVVVTAERGVVQVDRTTTTAVVNDEQLQALPVTSIGDAINLQAGVVDGRFRGGRSGEVAYLVNGVPINNAFNNQAAFEVEQNMVSSLEVISGVFNAEYGQALSGVVNIVTKDLPRRWTGSVLSYAGTIASTRELEFVTRTSGPGSGLSAADFTSERVPFYEAADFVNIADVQASLGGPIIPEKLGFQVTGRYLMDNGHLIGRNLFAPSDSSQNLTSGNPEAWILESTGNGDFVPLSASERFSVNTSLNYQLSQNIRLEYNLFWQDGDGIPFSHQAKYVPDGLNRFAFSSQTHIASLRYTIGAKSFGNVSYSYLRDKYDSSLYDEPTDPRYQSVQLRNLEGPNAFDVGGNDLFTVDELTETQTILADFSSQVNKVHLMKAGLQARLHRLDNRSYGIEKGPRTNFQPQISPDAFSDNTLDASPIEFSAYVQDKMEFTGLIVNAGLRFDYFDPDYEMPVDWAQAQEDYIFDPDNPESSSELCTADEGTDLFPGMDYKQANCQANRTAADIEYQISPRLGIAFPISADGVMRFSAGLFFQIPQLSLLYTNPEFEVNPAASSNQFGNPNLKPERTLAFEVGLQQGLSDDIGLELTLFSKDVRNLTGQEILRTPRGDFAIRWINRDYGTIRGFTFSLFRRPTAPLSWTLDYTLQFAEGTSSDPGQAFSRFQSGLEPILSLVRLNWDRRHVLNAAVTLEPSDRFTLTLVNRLRSGEPYTTNRNFVRSTIPNNGVRPLQFWSDLRAYYTLPFVDERAQLFVQVQNLFDVENVYAVWATTGSAEESLEQEQLATTVGGVNSLDEYYTYQDWFAPPRKVSLGLSLKF